MHRTRTRLRYRNGAVFSPGDLFEQGEQGAWFDPSDMTTLFQDDGGTVPVTASGQAVALMLDKSGNAHHAAQTVAGSRPIFRTGSGLAWLEFDGVNDFMVTGAINLASTDKVSAFGGVRKSLDTPTGMFLEMSADSSANNGTFAMTAPTTSVPGAYSFNLRGTVLISRAASTFVAPITNVISCNFNIGAADFNTEILPLVNGQVPTLTGSGNAGTGNFSSQAMYIGSRGGVSLPFVGNVYGIVVRGAQSTAAEVVSTNTYLASRSGVSL